MGKRNITMGSKTIFDYMFKPPGVGESCFVNVYSDVPDGMLKAYGIPNNRRVDVYKKLCYTG